MNQHESPIVRIFQKSNAQNPTAKILLIILLVVILLFPHAKVMELVNERHDRSKEVETEIMQKWAGAQTITGPSIIVPVTVGQDLRVYQLFATQQNLQLDNKTELRKRGIFETPIYTTECKVISEFNIDALSRELPQNSTIHLDRLEVIQVIDDIKGIHGEINFLLNGELQNIESGLGRASHKKRNGFHFSIDQELSGIAIVEGHFNLRGSKSLGIRPMGETTSIKMKSDWAHPSFQGTFLPGERDITGQGFNASWTINKLQHKMNLVESQITFPDSSIQVGFISPINVYSQVNRISKYAILFLCFTFTAVFIFEALFKVNVHPVQYFLTGAASIIFYVFLLSLSEHIPFLWAYTAAASLLTVLISFYVMWVFESKVLAACMAAIKTCMYGFLYTTIQIEDYALLIGSTGVLLVLAGLMIFTRNLNKAPVPPPVPASAA
ncbi:MAG: cell envelope integrity protein CreD [Lentisphaeria bacterium]|nr:cell envelope integrity protein CreD [Lentisphaeria bacterium]